MAGAIVASLVKWTADKLSSMIQLQDPASLSFSMEPPSSAEHELCKLESTMKRIHTVLDDAEERDIDDKSEQLRLRELREVAYDAEDAVDEYEYELLRAKVEARRHAKDSHNCIEHEEDKVLFDWNSCHHPKVSISNELVHRVREIRERFEDITDDWNRISLREKEGKRRRASKWKPIETTSFFDEATSFGREDEKDEIIRWLLQEDEPMEEFRVPVLAIVGMGGIGKTTLAQMVYNDARVCKYFDLKAWICVTENFDLLSITRQIMSSFSMPIDNDMNLNKLFETFQESLRKNEDLREEDDLREEEDLKEKKFFLVLDDVWNEKYDLWKSLKIPLSVGVGKIIVTTRNNQVAKIMQTTPPIYLNTLSFDHCWLLFEKITFANMDHSLNYNFLDIAQKIVLKCKGLPLAVKVLASILSVENDEDSWIDILESEFWELDEEKDDILPALRLSYDRMPTELRPCFMYLSLFPKGYIYEKSTLIKQWMSHGFLRPKGRKIEEVIGSAYFNELLQRSMLQYNDPTASEEQFIIHDLIHDLAQDVARDEYLLITTCELHRIPKTIRHLSLNLKDTSKMSNLKLLFEAKLQTKCFRTLIVHADGEIRTISLHNMTCLRTLILSMAEGTHLSSSIGDLKHLRYLDISHFPDSTYKLYHLQTLNSVDSHCFVELSERVGDMISLRHLHGYNNYCLPQEIGELTNLQTLRIFSLGAYSWQRKIRDLKNLVSIRGSFEVTGLETVRESDISNPPEAYLKLKQGIQSLQLRWHHSEHDDAKMAIQTLNCLRPHPNLRRLGIYEYPSSAFPTWLGDASFCKLQKVDFCQCSCRALPTLGQLPSLRFLHIEDMFRVRSVGSELLMSSLNLPPPPRLAAASAAAGCIKRSCCFPSLEELRFVWMHEWEEWHGSEDCDFPCLRLLVISHCPKLKALPSLSSVARLEISNCPALRRLSCLLSLHELFFSGEWNPEVLFGSCGCLPVLRHVEIYDCPWTSLDFAHFQSLQSLTKLVLKECPRLNSAAGLGSLAALQHLAIHRCYYLRISPEERLLLDSRGLRIIGLESSEVASRSGFEALRLPGDDSVTSRRQQQQQH